MRPRRLLWYDAPMDENKRLELGFGLVIWQGPAAYRFGTDAILLSHFAATHKTDRLADLGTGTGILPLLIHSRTGFSHCDALEINPGAAALAAQSVAENHLQASIRVLEMDYRQPESLPAGGYDAVVCNPPFSRRGAGLVNKGEVRAQARHEVTAGIADVCNAAAYLLRNGGSLYVIFPAGRTADLFSALREKRLEPKRICPVQPYQNKPANRILVQAVRMGRPHIIWEPTLAVFQAPGIYTEECKQIYRMNEMIGG